MAEITADRRVYEIEDGSLAADVPGGQRARLFTSPGRVLDGADADRYRDFVGLPVTRPEREAPQEQAEPADPGHPITPIVARGERRGGRRRTIR